MKLTERDNQILSDLELYRYMSGRQIKDLHFTSQQTFNRRMRLLGQAGKVKQIPDSTYYHLATTRPPKSNLFMKHFENITDFRIHLQKNCADNIAEFAFIPEYQITKDFSRYIADSADRINHTPDGVVYLSNGRGNALCFLEIDRGTESLSNPTKGVYKTLLFYYYYGLNQKHRRYQADFGHKFNSFHVLFVTTGDKRIENMRNTQYKLPDRFKRFVWLARQEDIIDLSKPVWKMLDADETERFRLIT